VLSRFLWRDDGGRWHRVLLEPIADGAVVCVAPTGLPLGLTPRELDVLTLMAEGGSNPQIAAALVVSPKTVAKHVEHVLRKLRCTSRSAAVARAIGAGLLRRPVPGAA
jgi:DNA-binding NarL/FixJ family response regulator